MSVGLVIFVIVAILNTAGLILDFVLEAAGRTTITQLVRTSPQAGWAIMFMQAIGFVGLFCHFFEMQP